MEVLWATCLFKTPYPVFLSCIPATKFGEKNLHILHRWTSSVCVCLNPPLLLVIAGVNFPSILYADGFNAIFTWRKNLNEQKSAPLEMGWWVNSKEPKSSNICHFFRGRPKSNLGVGKKICGSSNTGSAGHPYLLSIANSEVRVVPGPRERHRKTTWLLADCKNTWGKYLFFFQNYFKHCVGDLDGMGGWVVGSPRQWCLKGPRHLIRWYFWSLTKTCTT